MVDVKKRHYQSATRSQQAQATRARILDAATTLFIDPGYAATAMADVAALAGVALRTVYLSFPNKRDLLGQAIGRALAGDDAPVSIADRDWYHRTVDAPGPEILALFARFTTALHVRSAALLEAAEAAAAADPEVAERRDQGRAERRADFRQIAQALADRTGADPDLTTDLLYTLGSSAVYAQLVFQCGWTPDRYERWLTLTLEWALLRSA